MTYVRNQRSVQALTGIDLTVRRGEFLALLGPSGCGKTTLLRILAGLRSASEGSVEWHTEDPDNHEVGFVFQDATLLPWRTVQKNVELPLERQSPRRPSRSVRREEAQRLLRLVNLESFADAYPSELSGGMRQRASIARALVTDPAVLLMDEPFGALDAQTRDQMNLELQTIWMSSGKTAILVTHSIAEAAFMADRVAVFSSRPGRISKMFSIDFPRPRDMSLLQQPEFLTIIGALRDALDQGANR
jgi:NitT/TauT family transport system ATP-binding protein